MSFEALAALALALDPALGSFRLSSVDSSSQGWASDEPEACLTELEVKVCFLGFFLGLGWRLGKVDSSPPDKLARSAMASPGEDVADKVVDPEDELPASSFRLSGLGGGVSGMALSLSPSRLLKMLGRLGELDKETLASSRLCTGVAGRLTSRAAAVGCVIRAELSPPRDELAEDLLRFRVVAWLLDRFMATVCPAAPPPNVAVAPETEAAAPLRAINTDPCP